MKMSRYERFLARISPARAMNRYIDRQRLGMAQRAFESVDATRLRKKREDPRSPDQINSLATDRLRMQGRYLDENYDVARSVLSTLVSSVVGEGIGTFPMLRLINGDMAEEQNQTLQMLWEHWAVRPDVTNDYSWPQVQQLTARSWFRDGEMFTQKLMGNVEALEHSSDVQLSLELMEADFCPVNLFDDGSTPRVAAGVAAGNKVRQGVEKNIWGAPQAYWFWKNFPTEVSTQFSATLIRPISVSLSLTSANLRRLDALNIIHMKMVDRIRQTRGNSIFASVYTRLDDLKDYEESERVAARIGAAFAFAITKSLDTPGAVTPSEDRWREMDIAPGIIADNLQEGEEVTSLKNERPSNLIKEFRTTQLQSVAGGTGASFSSLSKQYDGSYSSQRQELMESFQIYRALRALFVNNFIVPIWQDFVRLAVAQGFVSTVGINPMSLFKAAHLGAGVPYIDPRREVEADEKRVAAGFRSRHETVLERGGNPEDTFRLLVEETERDKEAGLVFTSSAVPRAAAVTPPPLDEELEDEETDEEGMLEGTVAGFTGAPYQLGRRYEGPDGEVYVYTVNGFVKEVEEATG